VGLEEAEILARRRRARDHQPGEVRRLGDRAPRVGRGGDREEHGARDDTGGGRVEGAAAGDASSDEGKRAGAVEAAARVAEVEPRLGRVGVAVDEVEIERPGGGERGVGRWQIERLGGHVPGALGRVEQRKDLVFGPRRARPLDAVSVYAERVAEGAGAKLAGEDGPWLVVDQVARAAEVGALRCGVGRSRARAQKEAPEAHHETETRRPDRALEKADDAQRKMAEN
jgi:hypothetical protein